MDWNAEAEFVSPSRLMAATQSMAIVHKGFGCTLNISSHGALITSAREWIPGTPIKVVIEWPILLGSVRRLALHIDGTVVRSDHRLVALRFSTHEWRTQPKPSDQVQAVSEWLDRSPVPLVLPILPFGYSENHSIKLPRTR